jgi:hypothetical protein
VLFLGFESTDPDLHMFQELLRHRDFFFSPFPLVEEPHASAVLLAERMFASSQIPEEAAFANRPSNAFSNVSLFPEIGTDPSPSKPARTIEIFISYVEHDEKLLEELQEHLTAMQHQYYEQKGYNIKIWHAGELIAGQDWKQEIEQRLVKAHIILLLVSVKFLISELCRAIQIQPALERHKAEEAYIIPVILRSCDWKHEVFGHLHPLPDRGKPVIKWKPREDAYLNIIMGIRKAIDDLF